MALPPGAVSRCGEIVLRAHAFEGAPPFLEAPTLDRRALLSLFALLALAPAPGWAAPGFAPLPPAQPPQTGEGLLARVVRYDGSTNGQMVVELSNPTAAPLVFSAEGLFFVPQVKADVAPQRLGAVGGFDVSDAPGAAPRRDERLTVKPGQTLQAHLDVFCIDSHRASPDRSVAFRIGKTRLPRALTQAIDQEARPAAQAQGGFAAPQTKSATQSTVWKNRDAKWIRLDGEGQQEAGK